MDKIIFNIFGREQSEPKKHTEEFKNGEADKDKVIKCLLPSKCRFPFCDCYNPRPHIPCCEADNETSKEEETITKVKGIKLLCNATLWRLNINGKKYSSISVPTGSPYETEEYKCLRENEEKLIEAYQALKTVQICKVYEDVDF